MNRILVVYFSRTGYTRRVAEALAHALDAHLATIDEARPRLGVAGYLRSAWEALHGLDADIGAPTADPADFDLVVLGTPVWASHASSPARTFARRYGAGIERVALFCTLGGSGADAALAELQHALHHTPLATLALTDREIDAGQAGARIAAFAATLRAKLPLEALRRAA